MLNPESGAGQKRDSVRTGHPRVPGNLPGTEGDGMATTKSTAMVGLKHVYAFGAGAAEGKGDQKNLLGGKGANLA